MSGKWQLTLMMVKPSTVKNPFALQKIENILTENNFKIVQSKVKKFDIMEAEYFYSEHKNKFYFKRLVTYMTSGQTKLVILARHNAIAKWRELLGPTKVLKAVYSHPDSIRGLYGLTDTRNSGHGADSEESVKNEIEKLFPEFNISAWNDSINYHENS